MQIKICALGLPVLIVASLSAEAEIHSYECTIKAEPESETLHMPGLLHPGAKVTLDLGPWSCVFTHPGGLETAGVNRKRLPIAYSLTG